jgi:hypothetical protein
MSAWDDYRQPFERRTVKRPRKQGPIVALDLETTNIPRDENDPLDVELRYLTVYGEDIFLSRGLFTTEALAEWLERYLFTPERVKTRYVTWNGARFDMLKIFLAIVDHMDGFRVSPFVANGGALRGARITSVANPKQSWDLLDGMAMTGLQISLAEFAKKFAPDCLKLEGTIDFEGGESFCAHDPRHRAYAERDSEALYRGMLRCDEVFRSVTGRGMQVTCGNAGIKFFETQIPVGIKVRPCTQPLWDAIFSYGLRGGYVYVKRQWDGPAYQYDINQAYAAAMRDEDLPAGYAIATRREQRGFPGLYFCSIRRSERSPIPFYCKSIDTGIPVECHGEETRTFITSGEISCLRDFGWMVTVERGWYFSESFRMTQMVDTLEDLRTTCRADCEPGACTCPNDPIGTICKAIGNYSYGKTSERIPNLRIVLSRRNPGEGFAPYPDSAPEFRYFWCELVENPERKRYHRPQIATFITAHVRMKLFRAIMQNPDAFLKADTDSVCLTEPIDLPISTGTYGRWKKEHHGDRFIVLGKKCYAIVPATKKPKFVCKGLRLRDLSVSDFERWYRDGVPPTQTMVQTLGFRRGLGGGRYRVQSRRGTDFRRTAPHLFDDRGTTV